MKHDYVTYNKRACDRPQDGYITCRECRADKLRRQVAAMSVRVQRLKDDPSLKPHGEVNTYMNWGCRCAPCRAAWSVRMKARSAKRAQARKQASLRVEG